MNTSYFENTLCICSGAHWEQKKTTTTTQKHNWNTYMRGKKKEYNLKSVKCRVSTKTACRGLEISQTLPYPGRILEVH